MPNVTNNHSGLIDGALSAAINDRVCREHTGRKSEYSTAVRALLIGEINDMGARWANIRALAREAHDQKVARRSRQAPSLALHAADFGIVPVRRWAMSERTARQNRLASSLIRLANGPTTITAWAMAQDNR